MGKVKSLEGYEAAMQEVLDSHSRARMTRVVFTVDDAFGILEKHGVSLIDNRLWDALESMPVGLDDLIEDEDNYE